MLLGYSAPFARPPPLPSHYPPPTTHHPLPTTHYPPPTTHHPLLTTHYSPPTTHYPLPTTHYPLPFVSSSCTATGPVSLYRIAEGYGKLRYSLHTPCIPRHTPCIPLHTPGYAAHTQGYAPHTQGYAGLSHGPLMPPQSVQFDPEPDPTTHHIIYTPFPRFPQSQLQLWPHRERDANAEYDEEKDAEAAEDEDRHRAQRLKSRPQRATTAGAAAAAATTVMRHDVWSEPVATGARWFATSPADTVYTHGATTVYRMCTVRAGQASGAAQYDCRLPLRCSYRSGTDPSLPVREGVWIGLAVTTGRSFKSRPIVIVEVGGTYQPGGTLDAVTHITEFGGDPVGPNVHAAAEKELRRKENAAKSGLSGGRGVKRDREGAVDVDADEPKPKPKPKPQPVPEPQPATQPAPPLPDSAELAADVAIALAQPALARDLAEPLAQALMPRLRKGLEQAVAAEGKVQRDRLKQQLADAKEQLADAKELVQDLKDRLRVADEALARETEARQAADKAAAAAQAQVAHEQGRVLELQEAVDVWQKLVVTMGKSPKATPTPSPKPTPTPSTPPSRSQSSQGSQK